MHLLHVAGKCGISELLKLLTRGFSWLKSRADVLKHLRIVPYVHTQSLRVVESSA